MNDTGWMALDEAQQEAGKAAARLVEEAELSFVMLLFADDRVGAVISNIEPANAVKLIEQALKAAKATALVEDIEGDGRLH
jgi:hypothetical protein